jgi:hypothetical protein
MTAETSEPHRSDTTTYPNAVHRIGWCPASSMSHIREEKN